MEVYGGRVLQLVVYGGKVKMHCSSWGQSENAL
jgi:hypothetical protein